EGQSWQLRDRPPAGVRGVGAGAQRATRRNQRIVRNRDHATARIAARIAKRIKLLKVDFFDSCFFLQLAHGRRFERLVFTHKSARQRHGPGKRLDGAFYQQHPELVSMDGEDHQVNCDSHHALLYPITSCAFWAAARTVAMAPELNSRKSASMPSLKT